MAIDWICGWDVGDVAMEGQSVIGTVGGSVTYGSSSPPPGSGPGYLTIQRTSAHSVYWGALSLGTSRAFPANASVRPYFFRFRPRGAFPTGNVPIFRAQSNLRNVSVWLSSTGAVTLKVEPAAATSASLGTAVLGDWNTLEIVADGSATTVSVSGKLNGGGAQSATFALGSVSTFGGAFWGTGLDNSGFDEVSVGTYTIDFDDGVSANSGSYTGVLHVVPMWPKTNMIDLDTVWPYAGVPGTGSSRQVAVGDHNPPNDATYIGAMLAGAEHRIGLETYTLTGTEAPLATRVMLRTGGDSQSGQYVSAGLDLADNTHGSTTDFSAAIVASGGAPHQGQWWTAVQDIAGNVVSRVDTAKPGGGAWDQASLTLPHIRLIAGTGVTQRVSTAWVYVALSGAPTTARTFAKTGVARGAGTAAGAASAGGFEKTGSASAVGRARGLSLLVPSQPRDLVFVDFADLMAWVDYVAPAGQYRVIVTAGANQIPSDILDPAWDLVVDGTTGGGLIRIAIPLSTNDDDYTVAIGAPASGLYPATDLYPSPTLYPSLPRGGGTAISTVNVFGELPPVAVTANPTEATCLVSTTRAGAQIAVELDTRITWEEGTAALRIDSVTNPSAFRVSDVANPLLLTAWPDGGLPAGSDGRRVVASFPRENNVRRAKFYGR